MQRYGINCYIKQLLILLLYTNNTISKATLPDSLCGNWSFYNTDLRQRYQEFLNTIDSQQNYYETTFSHVFRSLENVHETENMVEIQGGWTLIVGTPFTWNSRDHCGIDSLYFEDDVMIPAKWTAVPESSEVVSIEATTNTFKLMAGTNGYVWVMSIPLSRVKILCEFDPTFWPAHTQSCSWVQTIRFPSGVMVDFRQVGCYPLEFKDINPTWKFRGCHAAHRNATTAYQNKYEVTWTYLLTPYVTSDLLITVLPVVMLAFTNPVIFLLPPRADGRIDMEFALLLANIVTLESANSAMPRSRQIPNFMWYMLFAITINVVGIVAAVCCARTESDTVAKRLSTFTLVSFTVVLTGITICLFVLLAIAPWPECGKTSCVYGNRTFGMTM